MPLEDTERLGQVRQPGAASGLRTTFDDLPAGFGIGHTLDRGAERPGQQLAAQAVADDGNVTRDETLQRSHFVGYPGQRVVDAHRPAHHRDRLGSFQVVTVQFAQIDAQQVEATTAGLQLSLIHI